MQRRRLRLRSAAVIATAALLLVGCSSSISGPISPAPLQVGDITVSQATGKSDVDPLQPVIVTAVDGILTSVSVIDDKGSEIEGIMTPDRSVWKSSDPLAYGRAYTVKATGAGLLGPLESPTTTFRTLKPKNQTKAYLTTTGGYFLEDGGTYGVGTVIVAHFDEDIPDKTQAERQLSVTTAPPVDGSWYWVDERNAHWRPQQYFAPGTQVTVSADIYGKQLGTGLYGQENSKTSFTIGPSHISIADDNTKQVSVYENGVLVRTMPTSMGRGGSEDIAGKTISFWTQPGVYTVLDKANPVVMDSSTYGLPINSRLGYKETIPYATRISTDGIYLHQLESTVWAQGNTNVSHGCLNLNAENAQWFYAFSLPGDVVEVRNTGGAPLEIWQNGDWSVPWDMWMQGSALS